ncbi:MAG TPA: TatD family hydrolase [Candidatus Saccharimonadales bacterium]|nr:TatD family hydrolase [Candidatus Saccharimonadales bacterium]
MLVDTHCHIHESDYPLDKGEVIKRAHQAGVVQIICVGTDTEDSRLALELANKHDGVFASIGVHPHYAGKDLDEFLGFVKSVDLSDKIVAIGEIGLDYHYQNEPSHALQIKILKQQIELALDYDLPIIFHVRDAYDDFWKVLDEFRDDGRQIRGVLHSFTDTIDNLKEGLRRGFYISVNGISTFTHDHLQKEMFASIPLDKLLLETDAPQLTPYPLRGKIKENEPAYVLEVAEFNGKTQNVSFEKIADVTTANARKLFNI